MIYAYILENMSLIYEIDNKPLFKLIRDCSLSEDSIYIDKMGFDRKDLIELCDTVASGDTVILRGIIDLADTADEIISILKFFGDIGVEIVSIKEDYYSYKENFNIISDMLILHSELAEKKRKLGIDKARAMGRMGRKSNLMVKDRVCKLKSANFPVNEILEICKISRSTYYRILKDRNIR